MKTTEPNQRLQTMRFKLPTNAIAQSPHSDPRRSAEKNHEIRIPHSIPHAGIAHRPRCPGHDPRRQRF